MLGDVKIVESLAMVDQVEDWSGVRSPGRARRRRRKYRQNIKIVNVPKPHAISIDGGRTLIMHPEIARQLRHAVDNQHKRNPAGARPWFSCPLVNMADVT